MQKKNRLVFCLMGPTASGKTDLAAELVQQVPFEVISVDSAMVYRQMDIGTAKPTPQELEQTPHHLIDIIDPNETYSAAQFCTEAKLLCEQILKQGKLPLLVGGTMMYFNALQKGMSSLPVADETLRQKIEDEALVHGWASLHQKLLEIDPLAAARIHPHDAQRISRALEVYYLTGQTLSSGFEQPKDKVDYQFINLALFPDDRAWLHQRIALRFEQMLEAGLIDEVKGLLKKWPLIQDMPAMRSVGYRQVVDMLQGLSQPEELKDKGTAATRQLAKRQLTWLRRWTELMIFDPKDKDCSHKVMVKVSEILDNQFF